MFQAIKICPLKHESVNSKLYTYLGFFNTNILKVVYSSGTNFYVKAKKKRFYTYVKIRLLEIFGGR